LALYAIERGIANGGMFFTVMAIALVVSRPVFGMVVDRFNYGYAIIPGLLIIIFSMLLLAQASTLSLLLVSGAAYGVGFGAAQTSLQAMAVSEAPRTDWALPILLFLRPLIVVSVLVLYCWGMWLRLLDTAKCSSGLSHRLCWLYCCFIFDRKS